jgi:peptidoglycan/LPS O-acetylase OafA/YrhL
MKKPYYLIFAISAMVVAALFIIESNETSIGGNYSLPIIFSVVVVFAIIVGIRRFKSLKHGEPSEDEYSKNIMQKTAAYSFYISLYLWLAVSYFSDGSEMDTQQVIGLGVVGMAIVFLVSWIFVKILGLRNE